MSRRVGMATPPWAHLISKCALNRGQTVKMLTYMSINLCTHIQDELIDIEYLSI